MSNKMSHKALVSTSLFFLFMVFAQTALAATHRNFTVSDTKSLAQIGAQIQNEVSSSPTDVYHIIFSNYTNLGQFKLDAPTALFDSIIFERDASFESDAVIQVNSTLPLFDLKRITGKVVFKGLAFELTSTTAVLIAGAEAGKSNSSLTMDSCFVYAENLSSTFLSWDAGETYNIDILRSFFVAKTGVKTTRVILSGGKVSLQNNLFNFPGSVYTTSYSEMNFLSNTINLSQFNFTGNFSAGQPATYKINRNLVAYAPTQDAFNGPKILVLKISGFEEASSFLSFNQLVNIGWHGFNIASPNQFDSAKNNNSLIDAISGKSSSTLWNWDVPANSITGKNNGLAARKLAYNTYPSDSVYAIKSFLNDSIKVHFKSANFPRQLVPKFIPTLAAPLSVSVNPDLRFMNSQDGAIHFGPFQVDQIDVNTDPIYGHPVLLAENGNVFIRQSYSTNGGPTKAKPSIFKNATATARHFFLAFVGNTPKGDTIKPSSVVNPGDLVVFKKVDSAGFTTVFTEAFSSSDKSLRYLGKSIAFQTNAVINDSVIFGVKNDDTSLQAYDKKSVYWLFPNDNNRLQTPIDSVVKNGRLSAGVAKTDNIHAFLVEKLTVPADTIRYKFSTGDIYSQSKNGYQIKIDSIPVDSLSVTAKNQFGELTKGIKYTEKGRGDKDSLFLNLTATAGQVLIEESNGIVKVDITARLPTANKITKQLAIVDTNKIYFLGVKFNILKDVVYNGAIEGLTELKSFKSSTSGILKFLNVVDTTLTSLQKKNWTQQDSVFVNPVFLGGTQLFGPGIVSTQVWSMTLPIKKPTDATKVEVWWSQGSKWEKLSASPAVQLDSITKTETGNLFVTIQTVPIDAQYVLFVERRPPPDKFVKDSIVYTPGKIEVKVTSLDPLITKQTIDAYCLEYKTFEVDGTFVTTGCDVPTKIGPNPVNISVLTTKPILYRIQYYSNGVPYGNYPFKILEGTSWDPDTVLTTQLKTKNKKVWHLIGFPFNGLLKGSVGVQAGAVPDSGVVDSMAVMTMQKISNRDTLSKLESFDTTIVVAGNAYLIGRTSAFEIKIPNDSKFVPLQVKSLTVGPGWNLIANPFPVSLALSKISVSRSTNDTISSVGKFWSLKNSISPLAGANTTYQWVLENVALKSFEGYLYYNSKKTPTVLDFDILAVAPLTKTVSALDLITVNIASVWGMGSMYLSSRHMAENVGYFAAPNSHLELRVGGGEGYLFKEVSNLEAINESVRINSSQNGFVNFSIPNPTLKNSPANFHYNLIDLSTGHIYDEISARNLKVTEGSNHFRLLAGSEANIQVAFKEFLSVAPNTFAVSQNFPNPVRGLTKVEISLPIMDSRPHFAIFQINDAQGRMVQKKYLKDLRVGKQIVSVDMAGHKPGIYFYQFSAKVNGRMISKQNKMLVTQ